MTVEMMYYPTYNPDHLDAMLRYRCPDCGEVGMASNPDVELILESYGCVPCFAKRMADAARLLDFVPEA